MAGTRLGRSDIPTLSAMSTRRPPTAIDGRRGSGGGRERHAEHSSGTTRAGGAAAGIRGAPSLRQPLRAPCGVGAPRAGVAQEVRGAGVGSQSFKLLVVHPLWRGGPPSAPKQCRHGWPASRRVGGLGKNRQKIFGTERALVGRPSGQWSAPGQLLSRSRGSLEKDRGAARRCPGTSQGRGGAPSAVAIIHPDIQNCWSRSSSRPWTRPSAIAPLLA